MFEHKQSGCAISTPLLALIGGITISSQAVGQTILRVDPDATGSGNGLSWPNAFTSLQSSIDAVNADGVIIWVAEDTYDGPITVSGSTKTGIRILGGFAGLGATDPDARNILGRMTILDGNDSTRPITFFDVGSDDGEPARLDGFVLRDGLNAATDETVGGGGAMHVMSCSLVVANCVFEDNNAPGYSSQSIDNPGLGGAVFLTGHRPAEEDDTTVRFINCIFRNNAASRGGALCIIGVDAVGEGVIRTDVQLVNCLFEGNAVEQALDPHDGIDGAGGAIMVRRYVALEVANCTIADNDADQEAGGIAASCETEENEADPVVIIRNCIVWNNTTGGSTLAQLGTAELTGACNPFTVAYCITSSDWTSGTEISNSDPLFSNTANGDYRLNVLSPALEAGSLEYLPDDDFDVDEDSDTSEGTPDLNLHPRPYGEDVTLGAYSKPITCCADLAGSTDGDVGVADLQTLLADWGDCPTSCDDCVIPEPDNCAGDVTRDCVVDVTDLLKLLAAWGTCGPTCDPCNSSGSAETQLYDKILQTDHGIVSDTWDEELQQFPNPPLTIYQAAADDFRAVGDDSITQVHWWGFYDDGGQDCTSGYTDDFTVKYYEAAEHEFTGMRIPGDLIATFTSEPTRVLMPETLGNGLPLYMYTLNHSAVELETDVCYFIEIRNAGGDADTGGCHWYWAFSDETNEPYSVFWVGASGMTYDQMGDPGNEANLAFGLNVDFERYDPEGACPIE